MQEDEYYSRYLNKDTLIAKHDKSELIAEAITKKIDEKIIELSNITKEEITSLNKHYDQLAEKFNQTIPLEKKLSKAPLKVKTFENFIKNTRNNINLNISIKTANEIIAFLNKNNIRIDKLFGNLPKNETPKIFLLSFGIDVDHETLLFLIKNLRIYGLTNLRITEESGKQNEIYIGSYAYEYRDKTVLLTHEFFF